MRPSVLFPDVEAALVGWLPDALTPHVAGVPVSTGTPNPRPDRFIRIQRTGGPKTGPVVDGAQVTVECWDQTAWQAADTASIVRAVLNGATNVRTPSGALIYRVDEFGGPALLPDPSGQPRYSWTVQVHVRGIPL